MASSKTQAFYKAHNQSLLLYLRVTPNAGRDTVGGIWRQDNEQARLGVKVAAPPDKGKANAAVIKLIAKRLGLPKSAITIISGDTGRLKTLSITGEPSALLGGVKNLAGEENDS